MFVFFGVVPVVGTAYVQTLTISAVDLIASVGVGLLVCAILITNNLRDIPGDTASGKLTLAVRLGDRRTRVLYAVVVIVALVVPLLLGILTTPWVMLASLVAVLALRPLRIVLGGDLGPGLVPALKGTSLLLLAYGLALGLLLGVT